ncbi:MAG: carboxypeptidase regulatory-like domain-containing protein, partial [Candidatus Eremiobacteraeota bacterium]|nr:carboxypeptidase regulatory-like domain-containing protein [Candidatus Eremiobacteraeota bacterium]
MFLPRQDEELLNEGVLAVALAATLLTGAVRDDEGRAIVGARVTGTDTAGNVVGVTTTDADGTFAFERGATPAAVRIECSYCRTVRVPVRDDG